MDLEDPELPGGDFFIVFNKELEGKWTWGIQSSREEISLLFLIRICKENGPGGSCGLGRRFPYCF